MNVEFVSEQIAQAKQFCKDPLVLIEQKLDFSCYVPDGFGTGDCLVVADHLLHIIDFKYGMGVLVDAVENPQMMLYAFYHKTGISSDDLLPRKQAPLRRLSWK